MQTQFCESNETLRQGSGRSWPSALAGFCILSAITAGLTGCSLVALAWWDGIGWLSTTGTALLVSTIGLTLIGAHFLDVAESRKRSATSPRRPLGQTRKAMLGVAGWAALFICHCGATQGQQTIFNVPTTDVLDRGKVYFELDVSFKFNSDPNNSVNRFSSAVPRIVVGTGHRVEIGLNVTGNIQPGADSTTLVPTIKWKAYDGDDNGWAIVTGDHLFVPVRNKAYNVGNYVYLEASKTFKTKTRITFGGYHFSDNVVAPNAQRAGGQFGFEQPFNDKFTIMADWYTGKHAAGYFTPGIAFKPHPKVTGYFGYSIGNTGVSRGNHFFLAEIGINFN